MLTKMKLAIALAASLVAGTTTLALANGGGKWNKQEMLQKYDTNGDGKLDDAEKAKMKADMKAKREARREKKLAQFDTNHDGKLDANERAAMKAAMAEKRFAKLDTNGDGVISKEEFLAGQKLGMGRHHGRGPGDQTGGNSSK
jgi:Ca2+-binding EF-hand superfamily protein